jgi:hypothetical protein
MSIKEISTSLGAYIQQEFVQEKYRVATGEWVRRCRAHRVTSTIAKEEVVSHECEELDLVRSKLDCHVRSNPPTHYLEFSSREALFENVARKKALFTINQLIDVPLEIQHEAIGKFLSHSLLKDMVPPYLNNPRVVKHKYDVLQNMKEGINTHLGGCRKSKLVMAKDIVCTLTSSQSIIGKRVVAKVFGVDRQDIPRVVLRRAQLDTMNDVF